MGDRGETGEDYEVVLDDAVPANVDTVLEELDSEEEGDDAMRRKYHHHPLADNCLWPLILMLPTCCLFPGQYCTPEGQLKYWRKYICYGYTKKDEVGQETETNESPPVFRNWFYVSFIHNRPKWVPMVLPGVLVWFIWLFVVQLRSLWGLFVSEETSTLPYHMTIVMVFGSIVAGATSEGGGSVAFPVLTLVFGVLPNVARDFSLMIQSVGMTAASVSILYSQILVDRQAIIWSTFGSTGGVILGLSYVARLIPPAYSKMLFVSIWFAFAINLFFLNRSKGRITFLTLGREISPMKKILLAFTGFVGGLLTSISGSGVDICMFSVLTLLFRLSEKTATPTSVVMMAINTCIGFWWEGLILMKIPRESWIYFFCCIPVVPLGAPIGALISSLMHRQVHAIAVYFTDTFQFIAAVIIVEQTLGTALMTVLLVVFSLLFFAFLAILGTFLGRRRLKKMKAEREERRQQRMEAVA